jgi:hypothetical protein
LQEFSHFIYASVACAIDPSVNTFFICHIFKIENSTIRQYEDIKGSTDFSSKPNFCNSFKFQQQNPLKNQYFSHLSSENCEINSIKSDWLRAFQQHQEHTQIPMQFSASILFSKI